MDAPNPKTISWPKDTNISFVLMITTAYCLVKQIFRCLRQPSCAIVQDVDREGILLEKGEER